MSCPLCAHAWAAGLFDGEGCITLYSRKEVKRRLTWRIVLKVQMKDPQAIHRLKRLYGGYLTFDRRETGLFTTWCLPAAKEVQGVLELWLPWLLEKKAQAVSGIEFCKFRASRTHSQVYSEEEKRRCLRWEKRLKALKHGS